MLGIFSELILKSIYTNYRFWAWPPDFPPTEDKGKILNYHCFTGIRLFFCKLWLSYALV